MMLFGCNVSVVYSMNVVPKCNSMNNHECQIRPQVININSNEPLFYSYNIEVNKYGSNCNNIYDPYSKLCVLDVIKYMGIKVINLLSRTNETRHIK